MHVDRHESFVRMIRGLSISGDVRGISGIGIYIYIYNMHNRRGNSRDGRGVESWFLDFNWLV